MKVTAEILMKRPIGAAISGFTAFVVYSLNSQYDSFVESYFCRHKFCRLLLNVSALRIKIIIPPILSISPYNFNCLI